MMVSEAGLSELPQMDDRPAPAQYQIDLIVMALQRDDWRKALIVDQLRAPQVWRISVFAPPNFAAKGKDITAALVKAAGLHFAQLNIGKE